MRTYVNVFNFFNYRENRERETLCQVKKRYVKTLLK